MEIINVVNTLPKHPTRKYALRAASFIKGVVVHHSAGNGTVTAIAKYHVEHNGWPGIGYHFVITEDGTVCKTNNQSTLSYHAGAGQNKAHLGVCLLGNFEMQEPTPEQVVSLRLLLKEIKKALPGRYVKGHRDIHATACPGKNLYALLPSILAG